MGTSKEGENLNYRAHGRETEGRRNSHTRVGQINSDRSLGPFLDHIAEWAKKLTSNPTFWT